MSYQAGGERRSRMVYVLGCLLVLAVIIGICVLFAIAYALFTDSDDESEPGDVDPSRQTVVAFLDVGQALSVAIVTADGHSLLFDAGNGRDDADGVILPFLREQGVERLDYLVLSHPHQDHVGGMPTILQEFPVDNYLDPVLETTNQAYFQTLELIDQQGINAQAARAGDSFALGADVSVEILWPAEPLMIEDGVESINENSTVLRVTHGEVSFMLTGDIERDGERALIDRSAGDLQADILQVAHHGSSTSTTPAWLDAVAPDVAVISAGRENQYGHPHREVVALLQEEGVQIYRTDLDGTVVVTTDGDNYAVGVGGNLP